MLNPYADIQIIHLQQVDVAQIDWNALSLNGVQALINLALMSEVRHKCFNRSLAHQGVSPLGQGDSE